MASSSSCGLKNSQCPDSSSSTIPKEENPVEYRFSFVDGRTGLWMPQIDGDGYGSITCPLGGLVVFHYPAATQDDIVQVEGFDDWMNCRNLEQATVLSPPRSNSDDNQFADISYYYHCSEPNATAYLTSTGHCDHQKVTIHTSATASAFNNTTGEWILHVNSLARVLRLLGPNNDRGYQTEALANTTTELIWCALDHCPHFAHDVHPDANKEECESLVFTLLGYVSRKRPVPQWQVAEQYYQQAIDRTNNTSSSNYYFCTAQSYLTQLYLSKGDWDNATTALETLCAAECPYTEFVQQVEQHYLSLNDTDSVDLGQVCGNAAQHANAAAGWLPYAPLSLSWITVLFIWLLIR